MGDGGIFSGKEKIFWKDMAAAPAEARGLTAQQENRGNGVFPRFSRWRSGRDSNPRAAFDDNTISSRARYDLFDTTAYSILLTNSMDYYTKNTRFVKTEFLRGGAGREKRLQVYIKQPRGRGRETCGE